MKSFILNSSNIEKDSFVWNMAGSLLMAFQSVIFLMILTRTVGIIDSGIFTIAYANANLFLNIGKFGVRNYQVSDVKKVFTFKEYLYSRWITTGSMIIFSLLYTVYAGYANDYSIEKMQVIIWMCLFKVADSIEDVYFGEYQKKGRLDIASKIMTLRAFITIVLFALLVVVTKNMLLTLVITTIFTSILMFIFLKWTYSFFEINDSVRKGYIFKLLKYCFPVFFSAFLAFYIGNAPKYAIDVQLTDELQACYGFISMPVFVIGLLNGFVFTPIIYKLSCMWDEKKIKAFVKTIFIQVIMVFLITLVCIIGAYLLGIPVLSLLYNTDLSSYKKELLVLLLGGGFLGLSGVLNTVITIIRYQRALAIGYGCVSLIAFFVSENIVSRYSIMGAALLYTLLMMILCLLFLGILIYGIWKSKCEEPYD